MGGVGRVSKLKFRQVRHLKVLPSNAVLSNQSYLAGRVQSGPTRKV